MAMQNYDLQNSIDAPQGPGANGDLNWFDSNHPNAYGRVLSGPGDNLGSNGPQGNNQNYDAFGGSTGQPFDPTWNLSNAGGVPTPTLNASDSPNGGLPALWDQNFAYADFTAPDANAVANDPGNLYALSQVQKADERGASAHGTLQTGGFMRSLNRDVQGTAAGQYQNVYNRDLSTYGTNRGNALDAFNIARGVSNDAFDRTFGVANANNANDLAYAGIYGRNALTGAGATGGGITDAANARGAGLVAGSNAWNQALTSIGLTASQIGQLKARGLI